MAALTQKQKRWIVERLAVYDSPSEVSKAFFEEYGVRIDRQQVNNYDGSKGYSRKRMARKLVAHFDETRERFLEETDGIAIAHKAYRLRRLDENERKAREMGNLVLSNSTLEQAAKESGDAFTNRRVLEGDPERPLQLRVAREELEDLTPEEKVALYRETIRGEANGDRS